LKHLQEELAIVYKNFKNQKELLLTQKGEILTLKAESNSHSVDAKMVQNFYYLFSITLVLLGGILEYVREYSVQNPPTVTCYINFVIFYLDLTSEAPENETLLAVKLHFSDVIMNQLSSISGGNRRIVSNYKSDEKMPYLIFSVEYTSDEMTVSTKLEAFKNFQNSKFESFNYNGREYKCIKKDGHSQLIMTRPFLEYWYDPAEKVQNVPVASVQNAPS